LRKLGGKAGHRAFNEREPQVAVEIPDMPSGLSKLAQKEWHAMIPMLQQVGMISRIDGKALAAYCHAYARWVEAESEVDRLGLIIAESIFSTKDGEEIGVKYKRNPAVTISQDALKLMKSFLIEFGMTPASRSRLRVDKPEGEEKDPFETYLRGASKPNANQIN
jgi:P27 family predicted phage terminase small subunit